MSVIMSHEDLLILLRWMDAESYAVRTIIDAVEKPWNWLDELAQAKADLAKPARIEEPGPWGVVKAGIGTGTRWTWVRIEDGHWNSTCELGDNVAVAWDSLIDPVLIRPGMEDS